MNPQDIQKAFEDRQNAVHQLRDLSDETRGSELTAEQQATFDAQNDAIDRLDETIKTGLRSLKRDQDAAVALDEFRSYGDLTIVPESAKVDGKVDEDEMFRQLANGEIRSYESFASENRDLTKGTDSAGGYTVATTMYDRIVQKLEDSSAILNSGVTILRTDRGEDITVPKTTTTTAAALVAEAGAVAESDPVFNSVTLGSYKYGVLVQASSELMKDSSFNISNFLADQGGVALGKAIAADIAAGSGSSRPKGLMNATTSFGTSASATTITAANILEVLYTMPQQYKNADTKWFASPGAERLIRSLQDSTNQYIWQPGMQAGIPDQLFGHDFITDGFIDAPTSGKKALGFCHAPSFFVRFAGGVNVESSTDYAFANDLVTLRFLMRMDCNGIDDNGLGRLTQA